MKGRDVIVSGSAVRIICKGYELEQALTETLHKNGVEITEHERAELCRDIGQAVEGKRWKDKQLTMAV